MKNNLWKVLVGIGAILIGIGSILTAIMPVVMPEPEAETSTARAGPILSDTAIVKVTGPAEAASITVSDPDDDGWDIGQPGFGSGTIELALKELTGREVYITSVAWILYDAKGEAVTGGTLPVDITVPASGTASIFVDITLAESEADLIDDVGSKVDDYSGSGRLAFSIAGRDGASGLAVTAVEGYADIMVTKE